MTYMSHLKLPGVSADVLYMTVYVCISLLGGRSAGGGG